MQQRKFAFRKLAVLTALLAVLVSIPVTGCKGLTENSYKSLSITGDVGTEAMRIVAKLYKEGYVSRDEYASARDVYTKYKVSYDAAVEALAMYKTVEDAGSEATLVTAFEELSRLAAKLSSMLAEFQARKGRQLT